MAWAWMVTVTDLDGNLIDCDVRHEIRAAQRLFKYWQKFYPSSSYKVTIGH